MKARNAFLVAALTFATVLTLPAMAQDRDRDGDDGWRQNRGYSGWLHDRQDRDRDRDGDHDRDDRGRRDRDDRWRNDRNHQGIYNDGYRAGMNDARRNSRFHPVYRGDDDDRDAYMSGYRTGWNAGRNGGGYYPNNGGYYPNNGGYYPNGGYGNNPGFSMGYQEGVDYGRHDASVGKAYRPTDSQVYHDGDYGYNRNMGDKGYYRQQFRQGYVQGYEQAYQGYNGRRNRWPW